MAENNGDPWFKLMVGHWWTPEIDLGVVSAAASKRQMNSATWHNFSEQLRQQLTTSLSPDVQKGLTADDIREAFTRGAEQASDVANTNGVISKSCASAHHCASDLNSRLQTIASEGKSQINQIQQSKDLAPIKLGKIVDVVVQRQQEANSAAAPHTQNVFEAMQNILDQRGVAMSARQFAQQHGIDTTRMLGSPSKETVTQQVKGLLGYGDSPKSSTPGSEDQPFGSPNGQGLPPPPAASPGGPTQQYSAPQPQAPLGPAAPAPAGPTQQYGAPAPQAPLAPVAGAAPGKVPLSGPPNLSGLPTAGSPLPMTGLSNGLPTNAFNPSAMGSLPQPNALAQGLNPALAQGAPMSGALNNVPPVTGPVQPQVPTAPAVPDAGSSVPAAAHAPAVDTPPPAAPPPVPSQSPVTDSSPTYLAGPAAAASSAGPAGPLPTYGSDIRPPTPSISAPTAPSSPAPISSVSSVASPASAPVSPSAGTGGLAQPVVRQPTALAHPAPAGIGEQAVAATAGGAAAGAASAAATARARLQRLVDFVASQEPRLRWSAGEQADGTTVLVTDLASGWIPPDIAIPSVVTLLDPSDRRGDIETLLGEVSTSASYTPLHYLSESADDTEPIGTSTRPRQVPTVDDLGWELGQATNWRDGLPQMAHTLAKAASTGTGVVDNEVEFLRQHLAVLRDKVLDSYPDDIDVATVSNWQLLASINSLAAEDSIGANYHFAWFQALNRVPSEENS
jgi:Family of unknown function (DUF5631)/Family of unknown function (DUF5632)